MDDEKKEEGEEIEILKVHDSPLFMALSILSGYASEGGWHYSATAFLPSGSAPHPQQARLCAGA